MNEFTEIQLQLIRHLAGNYWDAHLKENYFPADKNEEARERYIRGVIERLSQPG